MPRKYEILMVLLLIAVILILVLIAPESMAVRRGLITGIVKISVFLVGCLQVVIIFFSTLVLGVVSRFGLEWLDEKELPDKNMGEGMYFLLGVLSVFLIGILTYILVPRFGMIGPVGEFLKARKVLWSHESFPMFMLYWNCICFFGSYYFIPLRRLWNSM